MIWLRPGLSWNWMGGDTASLAPALDTALFDVDGVLIDTSRSYLLAVIHAAEWLVREVNGLADAPSPMISPEDVARFKLAGGFNSDWDCTRLFAALWTARLREWRGQPEAEVSMEEWAARASESAHAGRGGLTWFQATAPASAIPSAEAARWAHDEWYWGAELCRQLFGHTPRYVDDAPGFVHNEELLLDALLPHALASRGITRFGLITGREGPEVAWAVRAITQLYETQPVEDQRPHHGEIYADHVKAHVLALSQEDPPAVTVGEGTRALTWHTGEYGRSLFGAIIAATEVAKPDPRALSLALARLDSHGALYVGDTADDLELVLRYRREAQHLDTPPVLAVMITEGRAAEIFQARGADIILSRVTELPKALGMIDAS
jgi:phosphoglycolate phosphatase-like HAD superfamily hydrolase